MKYFPDEYEKFDQTGNIKLKHGHTTCKTLKEYMLRNKVKN